MKNLISKRSKQPSTWVGLALIIASAFYPPLADPSVIAVATGLVAVDN